MQMPIKPSQVPGTREQEIDYDYDNALKRERIASSQEKRETRKYLIEKLSDISVNWLKFTAAIVLFQGLFPHFLSGSVMIAFITTSLGTVLGLWGIGLGYYFAIKK